MTVGLFIYLYIQTVRWLMYIAINTFDCYWYYWCYKVSFVCFQPYRKHQSVCKYLQPFSHIHMHSILICTVREPKFLFNRKFLRIKVHAVEKVFHRQNIWQILSNLKFEYVCETYFTIQKTFFYIFFLYTHRIEV